MEELNKLSITLDNSTIVLTFGRFDEEVDVDEICKIDYTNLFGESITVSALLNRIGLLRAEAEEISKRKKFEAEIYEAEIRKTFRRDSIENGGKIKIGEEYIKMTEKALDEAILLDKGYQIKMKNRFLSEKNFQFMDSLFWSISDKSKKLNHMLPNLKPEEFENELIEGKINGFYLKKRKNLSIK